MEAVEQPEKTSDSDELVLTKQKKLDTGGLALSAPPSLQTANNVIRNLEVHMANLDLSLIIVKKNL